MTSTEMSIHLRCNGSELCLPDEELHRRMHKGWQYKIMNIERKINDNKNRVISNETSSRRQLS